MADIGGEELGIEDDCRPGDEIVDIVDLGVAAAVASGEKPRNPRDFFVDRSPRQCREEAVQGFDFVLTRSRQQFESNELTGNEGFLGAEQTLEKFDRRPHSTEIVNCDRGVDEPHSSPSRRKRSFTSPLIASTY